MIRPLTILSRSPFWAIQPEAITGLISIALRPDASHSWIAAKPSFKGRGSDKVAIIPIQGVLSKDGPEWFGTSYDTITSAAERAAEDPDVKHIVLSVDSPGGEVTGLPETAAVIGQVAKHKPVSAIVEGTSASAAYWLTSQARDVTLTPSGEVGSVGVRMMHVDISKMLENEGYKITELSSGMFKTEWSPYKPLTDEAVADMQPRLESVHQDFLNAVTSGRGPRASEDIKTQRFGEGRMFSAKDALSHGLVDRLQSTHDFYKAVLPTQEEDATRGPFGLSRRRLEIERQRFV